MEDILPMNCLERAFNYVQQIPVARVIRDGFPRPTQHKHMSVYPAVVIVRTSSVEFNHAKAHRDMSTLDVA